MVRPLELFNTIPITNKFIQMRISILTLSIVLIISNGCTSSDSKKIDALTVRLDSLEKTHFYLDSHPDDQVFKYAWFPLGQESFQVVNRSFYISKITTSFQNNGFQVTGVIGNLTSMTIYNPIVECSIKDSTTKQMVVSGYSGVQALAPGDKEDFNVFIPTTKTNVSEIGVLVRNYRM